MARKMNPQVSIQGAERSKVTAALKAMHEDFWHREHREPSLSGRSCLQVVLATSQGAEFCRGVCASGLSRLVLSQDVRQFESDLPCHRHHQPLTRRRNVQQAKTWLGTKTESTKTRGGVAQQVQSIRLLPGRRGFDSLRLHQCPVPSSQKTASSYSAMGHHCQQARLRRATHYGCVSSAW